MAIRKSSCITQTFLKVDKSILRIVKNDTRRNTQAGKKCSTMHTQSWLLNCQRRLSRRRCKYFRHYYSLQSNPTVNYYNATTIKYIFSGWSPIMSLKIRPQSSVCCQIICQYFCFIARLESKSIFEFIEDKSFSINFTHVVGGLQAFFLVCFRFSLKAVYEGVSLFHRKIHQTKRLENTYVFKTALWML